MENNDLKPLTNEQKKYIENKLNDIIEQNKYDKHNLEKFPEIPLYDQNDYENIKLFKKGNMADSGCGLVAYSMVLTYLFDDEKI